MVTLVKEGITWTSAIGLAAKGLQRLKNAARTAKDAILPSSRAKPPRKAKPPKPDPFALTPEVMKRAVEQSPYRSAAGRTIAVDAKELRFSQTTVSYRKTRTLPGGRKIEYTYDDIKNDLFKNGWPKDKPIDVVIMPPNGRLTSIDNTRLTAARELGVDVKGNPIKPVVRVRKPDEPLDLESKDRFFKAFDRPVETWGEVARSRVRRQRQVPKGEEYGLSTLPKMKKEAK